MDSSIPKLDKLRQLFTQFNIDAYFVPHNDAHDSEYIANSDERIDFISEFDGSSGVCFISNKEALLWTDSRYYIQAQQQLKAPWEMRKVERGSKMWYEHIKENYPEGTTVGYDPKLINAEIVEARTKFLEQSKIKLVPISENLIDKIWVGKPSEPLDEVFIHEEKWTGQSLLQKIQNTEKPIQDLKAQAFLTAKLDEIAWVLNLRCNDIPYNPMFKSFLLIEYDFKDHNNSGILYILKQKINKQVEEYLKSNRITVKDYNEVFQDLQAFTKQIALQKKSINSQLVQNIKPELIVNITGNSPIQYNKSIKNPVELQGLRNCHIRDGSALTSYFAWLENELVVKQNTSLNEYSAAEVLNKKRMSLEYNKGLSFTSISCSGPNAAIVHYHPTETKNSPMKVNQIYLLDSGGQYYDGTTDVTRTFHFSQPTAQEKNAYTRVLLGNLDVQTLIWPKKSGIAGKDIDVLARRHLWKGNLDYGHGTGHGVGFFLNVHENPPGISRGYNDAFEVGQIVTDEPGYYEDGKFGIRIEDQLEVVDKGNDFLGFNNMTICPYDRNLFDFSLLTQEYIDYINQYHQKCYELLFPIHEKNKDELAMNWVKKHTEPIVLK